MRVLLRPDWFHSPVSPNRKLEHFTNNLYGKMFVIPGQNDCHTSTVDYLSSKSQSNNDWNLILYLEKDCQGLPFILRALSFQSYFFLSLSHVICGRLSVTSYDAGVKDRRLPDLKYP